eukprot:3878049-Prymnesium_polylepis.1
MRAVRKPAGLGTTVAPDNPMLMRVSNAVEKHEQVRHPPPQHTSPPARIPRLDQTSKATERTRMRPSCALTTCARHVRSITCAHHVRSIMCAHHVRSITCARRLRSITCARHVQTDGKELPNAKHWWERTSRAVHVAGAIASRKGGNVMHQDQFVAALVRLAVIKYPQHKLVAEKLQVCARRPPPAAPPCYHTHRPPARTPESPCAPTPHRATCATHTTSRHACAPHFYIGRRCATTSSRRT